MKYYIINEKRLLELLKEGNQLNALECAGVDNWSGYWEAKDLYTDNQNISYEDIALEDLKNEFEYMETEYKGTF
jgi:hypothetical protein